MVEPISDADLADYAPHIAERAHAELVERAAQVDSDEAFRESLDDLLLDVPYIDPAKDKRKHADDCHRKHVDCLANKIQDLMQGA